MPLSHSLCLYDDDAILSMSCSFVGDHLQSGLLLFFLLFCLLFSRIYEADELKQTKTDCHVILIRLRMGNVWSTSFDLKPIYLFSLNESYHFQRL